MAYYFAKPVPVAFDEALARAAEVLEKYGFGVLTEIDVKVRNRLQAVVEEI